MVGASLKLSEVRLLKFNPSAVFQTIHLSLPSRRSYASPYSAKGERMAQNDHSRGMPSDGDAL